MTSNREDSLLFAPEKMNQNLPENQFEQMISQRDELRNEGEHLQQQQNGVDDEPTIILQENCS